MFWLRFVIGNLLVFLTLSFRLLGVPFSSVMAFAVSGILFVNLWVCREVVKFATRSEVFLFSLGLIGLIGLAIIRFAWQDASNLLIFELTLIVSAVVVYEFLLALSRGVRAIHLPG
jgi:phosphoglycerol transferase MdoB-like AlkP superfamily enzyme